MTVTESIFTKLSLAGQGIVKTSYTEYHKNPTKGLVTDTMSQIDRCAGVFLFLFCEELTLFIPPPLHVQCVSCTKWRTDSSVTSSSQSPIR